MTGPKPKRVVADATRVVVHRKGAQERYDELVKGAGGMARGIIERSGIGAAARAKFRADSADVDSRTMAQLKKKKKKPRSVKEAVDDLRSNPNFK